MTINSNFAVLLAHKSTTERRRIPIVEVAASTGITRATLQRWHNNVVTRFSLDVLIALCRFFDCQVGDLLTYIPDDQQD